MRHQEPAQHGETGHGMTGQGKEGAHPSSEAHPGAAPAHGSEGGHPQAEEHSGAAHWEHLAHYAHESHLAAEALEKAAHRLGHLQKYLKEVQASAKLIKTHAQMAYDLRRMRAGIAKLQQAAARGGKLGIEAGKKLSQAKQVLAAAEEAFAAERSAVRAAHEFASKYKAFKSTVVGGAKLGLGQPIANAAERLEMALRTSRVGRELLKSGRILKSEPFIRGLVIVGTALQGIVSYLDSTAKTTAGKGVSAALGAGAGYLIMRNPYVAAGDMLAPKDYKLSEIYSGGVTAVVAIGEGLLTSDTEAMDEFHRRSMQGHYGKVMQAASEAGEFWNKKGIVGGLTEFAEGVRWWVSH